MGPNPSLRYSQLGILLAALVLLGVFAVAMHTVRAFQAASHSVQQAQEIRMLLSEAASHLKDVNLHVRTYLTTGDERAVPARAQSVAAYAAGVAKLRQLTAPDAEQRAAVERLDARVKELLARYDEYMELRRTAGLAAVTAQLSNGEAKRMGDEIRGTGAHLLAAEAARIEQLMARGETEARWTVLLLAGGLALDVALVAAVVLMLRRDYRAREEAAAALRQQAAEIKDLYNRAPCGYHSLDADGRFVAINDTELAWLGYAREEVIGRMAMRDLLAPESSDAFEAARARLRAGGEVRDVEVTLQRRDGTSFPALINSSPVLDAAGRLTATRSSVFDLTERKRVEQVVHDARAYSESIVDTVREPLVILTRELLVNSANRVFYETFKLRPEAVVGRRFGEIQDGVWAVPELQSALARLVPCHEELRDFELAQEFPGLGPRVMLLDARKLYRVGNNTTMLLLAIEDVTQRKRAEARVAEMNASLQARTAELESANRELEAFSYSVSHDLRAPLRHIDYFASALEKQLSPDQLDAKARRHITTICNSARGMGQLIDDLLAFARLSRTELRRSRVNLNELVREARQGLQSEINGRAVTWAVSPLPEVEGDPALLRQVFANVLGNAVKYTRRQPDTRIDVSAQTARNGEVVVCVRDNGAGFDMKYADKLFGVFQRLHGAAEFEGTGVGLANVRRIVERHGGRIWAEAEVNRGAAFYFTLPPAQPARAAVST